MKPEAIVLEFQTPCVLLHRSYNATLSRPACCGGIELSFLLFKKTYMYKVASRVFIYSFIHSIRLVSK